MLPRVPSTFVREVRERAYIVGGASDKGLAGDCEYGATSPPRHTITKQSPSQFRRNRPSDKITKL